MRSGRRSLNPGELYLIEGAAKSEPLSRFTSQISSSLGPRKARTIVRETEHNSVDEHPLLVNSRLQKLEVGMSNSVYLVLCMLSVIPEAREPSVRMFLATILAPEAGHDCARAPIRIAWRRAAPEGWPHCNAQTHALQVVRTPEFGDFGPRGQERRAKGLVFLNGSRKTKRKETSHTPQYTAPALRNRPWMSTRRTSPRAIKGPRSHRLTRNRGRSAPRNAPFTGWL